MGPTTQKCLLGAFTVYRSINSPAIMQKILLHQLRRQTNRKWGFKTFLLYNLTCIRNKMRQRSRQVPGIRMKAITTHHNSPSALPPNPPSSPSLYFLVIQTISVMCWRPITHGSGHGKTQLAINQDGRAKASALTRIRLSRWSLQIRPTEQIASQLHSNFLGARRASSL